MLSGALVTAVIVVAILADRLAPVPVALPDPSPVLLPVTTTSANEVTAVAVKVTFDTPGQAVSRRSGILTEVRVAAQDQLKDGAVLLRVDGRPVVAMVSPASPYRDLRVGDRGADVKALQQWLRGQGFLKGKPDAHFGASTRSAVQRWQDSLAEKTTGHFDLGSVIWVGPSPSTVAEIMLTAGHSVNAGETVFSVAATVRSIAVAEPPGGIRQSGNQVLTVGDVSVPYVLGSGRVQDRTAAKRIQIALGTSPEGIGRVASKSAMRVKVIPASAVVTDSAGRTCVFDSVDGPPVSVTPLSGGLGGVAIADDTPLSEVLANPSLIRDDLSCA